MITITNLQNTIPFNSFTMHSHQFLSQPQRFKHLNESSLRLQISNKVERRSDCQLKTRTVITLSNQLLRMVNRLFSQDESLIEMCSQHYTFNFDIPVQTHTVVFCKILLGIKVMFCL